MKATKLLSLLTSCAAALSLIACGNVQNSTSGETDSSTPSLPSTDSSNTQPDFIEIDKDHPGTSTIKVFKDKDSTLSDCYIAPRNVKMSLNYGSISGLLSNNQTVCPSLGDVNLLVIPVHVPGSEAYRTDTVKEDLQRVFFSQDDPKMGYPSLSEFYKESSYGKLNFSGEVTDWFDISEHTEIQSAQEITGGGNGTIVQDILPAAVKWAVDTQNIDLSKYDANNDSYIDAVWLIYDHLDMITDTALHPETTPNSVFWNMTSWSWDNAKSEEVLAQEAQMGYRTSAFSWASFDMMYTGYCDYENDKPDLSDFSDIPLSSHTYIHETGHLLGLEDLYATDSAIYRPAGKFTMMDQNVGDFDSHSKMLLGWVTPYVVYGGSEILLREATRNDHQVIVIPSNYEEINEKVALQSDQGVKPEDIKIEFNPFSEYMMIDLYAPTSLNAYDTTGEILNSRTPGATKTGVRIYHVDGRIFKCTVKNLGGQTQIIFNSKDYTWNGERLNDNQAIFMPLTNNVGTANVDVNTLLGQKLGIDFNAFDQLRLIEATGKNTFGTNGDFTNDTLFDTETAPFNIYDYGMQFFNGFFTYNDQTNFPFNIQVLTLKEAI